MRQSDQRSAIGDQRTRKTFLCRLLFTALLLIAAHQPLVNAAQWDGVDESVVKKIAREHGREAETPLIDTDRGDVLLFAFLLAGAAGGFAAGYYWRVLTEQRAKGGQQRGET